MIERSLYASAFGAQWGRQMRFISGPRQSGKTTLSKMKLAKEDCQKLYYLWDLRSVRERYKEQELFFTQDQPPHREKKNWVCFDEIHKMPRWKNILKGIFDTTEDHYQFIITGSAKFDVSKRSGDSLSGRYFTFHLFPLTFKEVIGHPQIDPSPDENALDFLLEKFDHAASHFQALDALLEYGGFPEPFLRHSKVFQKKWAEDYLDRVIREDIGILTRIEDRDRLYDLFKLLPEMAGSPLSENSLAGHLETSPPTIKNYLKRLEDFYLAFRITPYSRNIKRSLLKASKWYLYDWTKIADQAKRFENFIAVELSTQLSLWTEAAGEAYRLHYIRDREKRETDFLIVKQNKPWLMIEVKLSDGRVDYHHKAAAEVLGRIPVVQICYENNICSQEDKNIFRLSASKFLL